jgi:hypothetical protein
VFTMHCTGSAYSSAASGVDGRARAIGGGVKRSAGAAVGKGGSGVVRIGVDGLCSGGDGGGGIPVSAMSSALRGAIELAVEASHGEEKEGGCHPPPRPSTALPRIALSLPSLFVLQAVEMV